MSHYNNIGIGAISLIAILNHTPKLNLSKAFLIFPLIAHKDTLNYLARKSTSINNIDHLIITHTQFFSNFNERYYDSLILTFNAIQYLHEVHYIVLDNNIVKQIKPLEYNKKMGNRAGKIYQASKNIANILNEDNTNKLYLNLRIKL